MHLSEPQEKELVHRLIQGDEEAFCELYAAYRDRLIYFGMRFLQNEESVEDVFQDTFGFIWKNRMFINPDMSFSSYVYTIVRNRILNQLREAAHHEQFCEYIMTQAVDYSENTRNEILSHDLERLLQTAVGQLTPRQQEIFKMSREEHLTHKEIAEKLGLSVYTVQESITNSLKSIRNFLKKHAYSEANLLIFLASTGFIEKISTFYC